MDYRLFRIVNSFAEHNTMLDAFARNTATYGAFVFPVALVYVCLAMGGQRPDYRTAFAATASVGLALLVGHVIGYIHFRPRPFAHHHVNLLLGHSPDPSFPSDHAAFAFAFLPVLWHKSREIGWLLLPAAGLLALSRVFCGTHYPGDVTGGALLGILAGLSVLGLSDRRFAGGENKEQAAG